jgi:hypothetical protein
LKQELGSISGFTSGVISLLLIKGDFLITAYKDKKINIYDIRESEKESKLVK